MRAVIYLRVSTDEQSASGAGLNAQLDACRSCAERAGWEPVGPFSDEGISGAAPLDRRPAMIDAMAAIGRGDVLVVAKRDRLGRDPIAVALIERAITGKGGRVVSAAGEGTDDDSPASVLMRRVIDAVAEYERLVIRARTKAALVAKKRRQERTGKVPYGHTLAGDGKALVEDPAELEVLDTIRRLKARGLSLRAIALELDRLQVPTKTGRPRWNHFVVSKLLNRPT